MLNNKRGFFGIIFVIGALMLISLFAVALGIGSATINWVMDETVPELNNLGQVGDWNSTETMDIVINPVNNFIQSFTWMTGVIYILGILGVFGLAFAFRTSGNKWMIGLFFALVLILVITSMFMSNIYEDVYRGTDDLALILQEHAMLSWLVLYSPGILAIIAFIAGIILFSGDGGSF